MKTVFSTREAIHVFFSQEQEHGRNQGGTVFFAGNVLYSYGYHYPMAVIQKNDLVFINSEYYSQTTAKHQSYTRVSIPYWMDYIHLPHPLNNLEHHRANSLFLLGQINLFIHKFTKARVTDYSPDVLRAVTNLQSYFNFMLEHGIDIRKYLLSEYHFLLDVDSVEDVLGSDYVKIVNEREDRKRQAIIKRKQEQLNRFLGREDVKYREGKAFLRYNEKEDTIETSERATVSAREARILYERIKAGKDIKGFKVGYYTVISINGDLKIGCHAIPRSEVDRLANILGW
jgi:hypothetical protein